MRYIGIDLAWGTRNTTAAVVLEGTNDPRDGARAVAMAEDLQSDDDILAFVDLHAGSPQAEVIVTIDAPMLVPNEAGRRPCEAVLSSALAKFQAGPHPANRRLVGDSQGIVRGERIAARLTERGIPQTPYLRTLTRPIRACFEVFPHPAHVALFGLDRTLKYKAKPNRLLTDRIDVFRRYVALLGTLSSADPPLILTGNTTIGSGALPWWQRDPTVMTEVMRKRHEDALDALTCAYVGLYHYRWGNERSQIVGDLETGYIVMPVTLEMRNRLADAAHRLAAKMADGGGTAPR